MDGSGESVGLGSGPSDWLTDEQMARLSPYFPKSHGKLRVDDIIALADSEPPAHLEGPALSAWVQQLKLRVHAREWTAAKLRPRVYGEKIDVSVQHTQISVLAALERAEKRLIDLG